MKLRQRFLIIITLVTLICIAGITAGLSQDISNFWNNETQKKIAESRNSFFSSILQLTETAEATAHIIASDELIERYFTASESDRYVILFPTVARYLNTILELHSSYQEINLLLEDGFEDIRVSRSPQNVSETNESPLFKKAWQHPSQSFINFEYNHDLQNYTLNLYQAIELVDRSISARQKKVRAVVQISMSLSYLQRIAEEHLLSTSSFIAIHNNAGKLIMNVGDVLPEAEQVLASKNDNSLESLKELGYITNSRKLFREWHLFVGVPSEDAFSDINSIIFKEGITLLLFFGVLGIGIFIMLSRTIIKPLDELVDAAKQFSSESSIPTFTPRKDEIGILQSAFLRMAENIRGQTYSLRKQAYTDTLTGLPNRNLLPNLLEQAIKKAEENTNKVGLLFIDLDGFKQVNDVFGHGNGDKLLQKVADRLGSILRTNNSFYQLDEIYGNETLQPLIRLGGDEFTVVLPDIKKHETAAKISQRLIDQFSTPFEIDGREVFVGASIGIAIYPDDAKSSSDMVKYADTAMYAAKSMGKMCFCFFDSSMFNEDKSRLQLENILRNAIIGNEFWAAFQAQVDPFTQKITGFEALARLSSSEIGEITPDVFIPVAESIGIIDSITLFLIEYSCNEIKNLKRTLNREFTISINISPAQLGRKKLFLDALDIIRRSGVAPSSIEFEITESSLIDQEDEAEKNLTFLQNIGFHTALDDFGVGYSSLGHLKRYPFDTLKIDQIFFRGIENDETGKVILTSIIKLARKLGMTIVVEGIETPSQLNFAIDSEIDLVQGYIYSKPVDSSQFIELINDIESNTMCYLKAP